MSKTTNEFSPEVRKGAVRMVLEREGQHVSRRAAIVSISAKTGCAAQTLNVWVKKAEVVSDRRAGVPAEIAERLKALERENCELRQANEILPKASAQFSMSELYGVDGVTAPLRGSSQTHLGTPTPLGSGHIINAERRATITRHQAEVRGFPYQLPQLSSQSCPSKVLLSEQPRSTLEFNPIAIRVWNELGARLGLHCCVRPAPSELRGPDFAQYRDRVPDQRDRLGADQ